MSPTTSRILLILLILLTLLALAGCGTSGTKACNASNCCAGSDACAAPRFIYATGINGQIATFPVSPGGGLGTPTTIPGPSMTFGLAALNSQFLYVSNLQVTQGGASSIGAWSINQGTGALTTVPGSPFSLGPLSFAGGLAVDNSAQVLYVGDAGRIDALKADATGALSPIMGSPFSSGTNIFLTVDPQNRFLFAAADNPPGQVFAFTIDSSSGALTPVPGSPFDTIPGFTGGTTRPGEIVVDSTGNFVYTTLTATGQIAGFQIMPSGALTLVPGSPFAAGAVPLPLATTRNFLYVSNGGLSGYSIDPTSGVLTPLANSLAIAAGAITIDPEGNFLYTSGSGGAQSYIIDSKSGALTPVGSAVPFAGATVLAFVQ